MIDDNELREVALGFRKGLLDGLNGGSSSRMCYAVSWPLQGFLSGQGVECELAHSDQHYWISLPDGRVLDPTFDQLQDGGGPIYIGPPIKWHGHLRRR